MNDPNPIRPDEMSAWPAQSPPPGFSSRVMAAVALEPQTRRDRWRVPIAAAVSLAAAAGLVLAMRLGAAEHGELVAEQRTEATLGARAVAVLEPGANISWRKTRISQKEGKVLYRVEPGTEFYVSTPAGQVQVLGTVFSVAVHPSLAGKENAALKTTSWKSAGAGALLGTLVTVAVYEGRVRVVHAGSALEAGAGESVHTSKDGLSKASTEDDDRASSARALQALGNNASAAEIAEAVKQYKERLELIEAQRNALSDSLRQTEERLQAATSGEPPRTRHEFDLDTNDWRELAKTGTVKYRLPCNKDGGWRPSDEALNAMGLAPSDADVIQQAYKKTNDTMWSRVRPLCRKAIGIGEDVVDRIGLDACMHLIEQVTFKTDEEGSRKAFTQVGEIMAGDRVAPSTKEKTNPIVEMFLTATQGQKLLETELAAAYGPEEAKRLAYDKAMCHSDSTWGGRPKK